MWLFAKNSEGKWLLADGKESYTINKPAICLSYHPDMDYKVDSVGIRATLHKFGEAARVRAYFEKTHKLYMESGLEREANELVYMDFEDSFDVNELNKCIEITGYVALLYERSISNELLGKGEGPRI
jgi:hypothetical protein